jgi:WD40 repeat protein
MSYCLNPGCPEPENSDNVQSCQSCGLSLLLKERYRAIKPIGQGGFGKTFLAVDEHMPSKQQCVIKQFFNQSSLKAQKAKELFVQEAVQLEKLGKQHPQIPQLLAHVELGIGLFLVQEFIDGQDLLQELKQEGVFDEAKIRQLLNDLLPVLQFIHTQQVIHRDIKPENIIRRQSDGKPVLVDFGISKFVSETALERTGTVIGTPGYAAPEQSEGKVYFSTDLFGLGRTCFHLLTDNHPTKVFSPYGNWEKYLSIHLNKSGISEAVKHILTKLLQPDISQRYQSAEEVIQNLNLEVTQLQPLIKTWKCVHTFTGHINEVSSVAISPDGQTLVSGSWDNTIKIWQLDKGQEPRTLTGHSDWVYSIALSSDGQILASGSWDKTIKIWQLDTGEELHTLRGHSDRVYSVAFSPDGQTLASGSLDKTIEIWRLRKKREKNRWLTCWGLEHTLIRHSSEVSCIAFSPNERTLASGSWDKTIKIWQLNTGEELHTFRGHSDRVYSVAFSPDGQTLASSSSDAIIKIWQLDKQQELCTLTDHSDRVYSVTFSPDGKTLASGSWDKTVKIWRCD